MVVSNIFYFHPYLGKISILTNIFQRGWNHQLVLLSSISAKKAGAITQTQKANKLMTLYPYGTKTWCLEDWDLLGFGLVSGASC